MSVRTAAAWTMAAAFLGACQSSGPRQPHMMAASGDRALDQGDYVLAEQEYAQVVAAQPWNANARLQYGKALLGVDKPREAREQLEQAYTLLPKNDDAMITLAEAMGRTGDYDGGARLLQSIAEERRRPADWNRLGRYAQRGKDYDTAEKAYLAAALGDGGLTAQHQMALHDFYVEIGDEAKAVERLRMAFWLEPQNEKLRALIRERGYVPSSDFAQRPVEQTMPRIPEPTITRPGR
jgi:tetratricopeptide (TPR) repeat protein